MWAFASFPVLCYEDAGGHFIYTWRSGFVVLSIMSQDTAASLAFHCSTYPKLCGEFGACELRACARDENARLYNSHKAIVMQTKVVHQYWVLQTLETKKTNYPCWTATTGTTHLLHSLCIMQGFAYYIYHSNYVLYSYIILPFSVGGVRCVHPFVH